MDVDTDPRKARDEWMALARRNVGRGVIHRTSAVRKMCALVLQFSTFQLTDVNEKLGEAYTIDIGHRSAGDGSWSICSQTWGKALMSYRSPKNYP